MTNQSAKGGMTDLQLVTRAAQKAETAIGDTGGVAGTAKHQYASALLNRYQSIYGSRGLSTNVYFNNGVGNRGFLDVLFALAGVPPCRCCVCRAGSAGGVPTTEATNG